jgi:drug/metabolite transporter (DMT)-like permease
MALQGILLIIVTGLLWAAMGVAFSYIAKKSMDFTAVMGLSTLVALVMAWNLVPDYQVLLSQGYERLPGLATVLVLSGFLSSLGLIAMQKGMQTGHNGIVWTIGQSALIAPYLAGVLIFQEPVTDLRMTGMSLVLFSLVILGITQSRDRPADQLKNRRQGYLFGLLAFAVLAIHQIMATLPSHWHNWTDDARLRVPLLTTGVFLAYPGFCIIKNRYPRRNELLMSLGTALIGFPASIALFKSMDYLEPVQMVSLVFPLSVGTCIFSFLLFSFFILKEKTSYLSLAGLICGLSGMILTTL